MSEPDPLLQAERRRAAARARWSTAAAWRARAWFFATDADGRTLFFPLSVLAPGVVVGPSQVLALSRHRPSWARLVLAASLGSTLLAKLRHEAMASTAPWGHAFDVALIVWLLGDDAGPGTWGGQHGNSVPAGPPPPEVPAWRHAVTFGRRLLAWTVAILLLLVAVPSAVLTAAVPWLAAALWTYVPARHLVGFALEARRAARQAPPADVRLTLRDVVAARLAGRSRRGLRARAALGALCVAAAGCLLLPRVGGCGLPGAPLLNALGVLALVLSPVALPQLIGALALLRWCPVDDDFGVPAASPAPADPAAPAAAAPAPPLAAPLGSSPQVSATAAAALLAAQLLAAIAAATALVAIATALFAGGRAAPSWAAGRAAAEAHFAGRVGPETVWLDPGPGAPDVRVRVVRSVFDAEQRVLGVIWEVRNLGRTPAPVDLTSFGVVAAPPAVGWPAVARAEGAEGGADGPPDARYALGAGEAVTFVRRVAWTFGQGYVATATVSPAAAVAIALQPVAEPLPWRAPATGSLEAAWQAAAPPLPAAGAGAPHYALLRPADGGCDWLRQAGAAPPERLAHVARNCSRLPVALAPDGRRAAMSRGAQVLEVDVAGGAVHPRPAPAAGNGATLAWYAADGTLTASFVGYGAPTAGAQAGAQAGHQDSWPLRLFAAADDAWAPHGAATWRGDPDALALSLAGGPLAAAPRGLVHAGVRAAGEAWPRTYGDALGSALLPLPRALAATLTAPPGPGTWVARAGPGGHLVLAWLAPPTAEVRLPLRAPVYLVRGSAARPLPGFTPGSPVTVTFCGAHQALVGGSFAELPAHTPDARAWSPFVAVDLDAGTVAQHFGPEFIDVQCWPESLP